MSGWDFLNPTLNLNLKLKVQVQSNQAGISKTYCTRLGTLYIMGASKLATKPCCPLQTSISYSLYSTCLSYNSFIKRKVVSPI